MRHAFPVSFAVLVLTFTGCSDDSPAAPTPQFPQVAGTYTGTVFVVIGTWQGVGTGRLVVRQAGSELTVEGTMTFPTFSWSVPAKTGTISATGYFTSNTGGLVQLQRIAGCGFLRPLDASLTFAAGTARYVEDFTTDSCGSGQVSSDLVRQ